MLTSPGLIGSDAIEDAAIIASKIAANAIVASKIAAGAVTAEKIAAGTITADRIEAGVIPDISSLDIPESFDDSYGHDQLR